MMTRNQQHGILGNALLVAGLILLVTAAVSYAWPQYEGQRLRARLREVPAQESATAGIPASRGDRPAPAPGQASESFGAVDPLPGTDPAAGLVLPTTTRQPPGEAELLSEATPGMTATRAATPVSTPTPTATPTASPTATPAPAPVLPVRLVIPDLGIDTSVVEMGWKVVETADGPRPEWEIPQYAAGYHTNSAPLGVPGNVVISGHNNIYGRVFAPISLAWDNQEKQRVDDFTDRSDILNGRVIQLYGTDGRRFDYMVTDFYRVLDQGVPEAQRVANARFLEPTQDARVTLVTCWPITSNTYRLIVVARPVG